MQRREAPAVRLQQEEALVLLQQEARPLVLLQQEARPLVLLQQEARPPAVLQQEEGMAQEGVTAVMVAHRLSTASCGIATGTSSWSSPIRNRTRRPLRGAAFPPRSSRRTTLAVTRRKVLS